MIATPIDQVGKALVAISGGADSMALLHMLVARGVECVAAHCNFHLRGDESNRDEEAVRLFCASLNVPLFVQHFDTKAFAQQNSVSIEMAARQLRYEWFDSLLDQHGLDYVAVAHHADDMVETFFLNLARGAGLRGLSGMKPVVGRVVRPMLDMSRADVEAYCHEHSLPFVTDSSNASDDYVRNRIRHHVVPEFKGINPSFLATMRNNFAYLSSVYEAFVHEVEAFADSNMVVSGSGASQSVSISVDGLRNLPNAEPYLFEMLGGYGFSSDSIRKMSQCVSDGVSGKCFWAGNVRALVDRAAIVVKRVVSPADEAFEIAESDVALVEPIRLALRRVDVGPRFSVSRSPLVAHLDLGQLRFPLILRRWRLGDSFRPLGMKGFKKVSDFFVDGKFSLEQKEDVWILESDGRIAWIVGHRIDDRFKVSPSTRSVLEVRVD